MTEAVLERPTEATSAPLPAVFATPETTGTTSQNIDTIGRPWVPTELPSAPPSATVVHGTRRTIGVDDRDRLFGALVLWLAAVWTLPRRRQPSASSTLEPAEAVERLLLWTGLSAEGVADLLGVTRRSLYHWSSGTTRPRHQERLLGLVKALEPAAGSWASWELREWLAQHDARQLVLSGDMTSLRRHLEDSVRPSAIRRLQPARAEFREEVEPLDSAALQRHYRSAIEPRPVGVGRRETEIYVPRELTDSFLPEEE